MPLPPTQKNLADDETFTVKVFRDDPKWDQCEKWWMLAMHTLNDLFVCAYDCDGSRYQLDWIEQQHPGCVFVY